MSLKYISRRFTYFSIKNLFKTLFHIRRSSNWEYLRRGPKVLLLPGKGRNSMNECLCPVKLREASLEKSYLASKQSLHLVSWTFFASMLKDIYTFLNFDKNGTKT